MLHNDGSVQYILNSIADVTAKVQFQQTSNTLLVKNGFVEDVLQNLPIGIAVNKISDGSTTMVNNQFSKIDL